MFGNEGKWVFNFAMSYKIDHRHTARNVKKATVIFIVTLASCGVKHVDEVDEVDDDDERAIRRKTIFVYVNLSILDPTVRACLQQ